MASGDAEHKRRQRARNAGATRAGSSGITKLAGAIPKLDIEQMADDDELEHIGDLTAVVESGRIYANGAMSLTVQTSAEYTHDLVDVTQGARGQALVLRAYVIPMSAVLGDLDDDDA